MVMFVVVVCLFGFDSLGRKADVKSVQRLSLFIQSVLSAGVCLSSSKVTRNSKMFCFG